MANSTTIRFLAEQHEMCRQAVVLANQELVAQGLQPLHMSACFNQDGGPEHSVAWGTELFAELTQEKATECSDIYRIFVGAFARILHAEYLAAANSTPDPCSQI